MAEVALSASVRNNPGTSDARRLRSAGQVPAVVYGHGVDPTAVSVEAKALRQALNTDAGLNALINLDLGGQKHLTLARGVQLHPVRNTVSHVDFQIVRRDEIMTAEVPLNFTGDAIELRRSGGIIEYIAMHMTISATPSSIPAHLDIDVTDLAIDESIRVKDVKLPNGVTTDMDPEEPLVVGVVSRAEAQSAEDDAAAEGAEGAAEEKKEG